MYEIHNDLSFLPEGMKIVKTWKLAATLHGKIEYGIHIRNLKQASDHELVLKKVRKVIKFYQNSRLKL